MKQNRVWSNVIYNIGYHILILIVPFVTAPYVSRVLHPEGLGTYSVTTAIAKYFWMFGLLGMANYGNRRIAAVRDDTQRLSLEFTGLFCFQLLTSLLSTALFLGYTALFGFAHYGIVILCQLPYLLSAVFEVSWFFSGTEQFRFMVIKNSIIKLLTMGAVFLFVKTREHVWIYVLINTLSLLAGQLTLWPVLLKQIRFCKISFAQVKQHLRPNLVLMVSVIAVSIYVMMDKIMIEWLSSRAQVGFYENTEKMLNMSTGIVGAIGTVMLPRMTYLMSNEQHGKSQLYLSKSLRYIMTFAIAVGCGIAGVGREFAVVYFGPEYALCGPAIAIISLALLFYSWENILKTQYLLPHGRDSVYVKGTVAAAVCNLVLNFLFIPRLGAIGAVIGTVGAQAAAAVYESLRIRKELPLGRYLRDLAPVAGMGALMFGLCRWIGAELGCEPFTLLIQVAAGGLLFLVLCGLYYGYKKDELFMKLWQKVRLRTGDR